MPLHTGRNAEAPQLLLLCVGEEALGRLDTVEARLGRTRYSQQAELEVALALEQLHVTAPGDGESSAEMCV